MFLPRPLAMRPTSGWQFALAPVMGLALIVTGLLAACQPDDAVNEAAKQQDNTVLRANVDALDKETADRRRARLSGVEYDLSTALRFLREAHQADVECLALRAVQ